MHTPRQVFFAVIGMLLLQTCEAFARSSALKQTFRVGPKLFAQSNPDHFPSTSSPSFQRLPSKNSRKRSPLFSSAAAGAISTVSVPVKRGLLGFRGGSAGLALTQFTKSILDDVASSKTKSWAVLIASVLIETVASTLSKKARDTSNPGLFVFSLGLNFISLCGFCTALAKLDVGVAYAMWAALGTVVVTAAGVIFFQEAMDPLKLISILLVILGVVGLNLSDAH